MVPDEITPLSVIGLLERIMRGGNLNAATKSELERTLATMQGHYYAPNTDVPMPNLADVAKDWVAKAARAM